MGTVSADVFLGPFPTPVSALHAPHTEAELPRALFRLLNTHNNPAHTHTQHTTHMHTIYNLTHTCALHSHTHSAPLAQHGHRWHLSKWDCALGAMIDQELYLQFSLLEYVFTYVPLMILGKYLLIVKVPLKFVLGICLCLKYMLLYCTMLSRMK